jgi:hypothetical protein
MTGETPSRCPESEIAALKDRVDERGVIRLPAPPSLVRRRYAAGTRVSVIGGPFRGVAAIHTGMTEREREVVLIGLLGAQRSVAIESHLIAAR